MMNPDVRFLIALLQLKGVGSGTIIKLLKHYGSAQNIFEQLPNEDPSVVKGIGQTAFQAISGGPNWVEVEREMEFILRHEIQCITYNSPEYPRRLKFCQDAPCLLYSKGNVDFNHPRILAVVGTRRATPQGKEITQRIIADLASQNVLIISGLAFGIDVVAHQAAIQAKLPTIAVVAHGLDRLYPPEHKGYAREIIQNGALLTEFPSNTNPDKENFPKRNRIVAGMADAVLVVESQRSGGSMITADLGFGYGRDVFAIPGRPNDSQSEGCNYLIRSNKAALVESAADIRYFMNWNDQPKSKEIQKKMFIPLSDTEEKLVSILHEKRKLPMDELCFSAGISVSQSSVPLLNLEMNGMIPTLPGKVVELI